MPRFFFDFWDHKAFVSDPNGIDLADIEAVRREAAREASQLLAEGRANGEDRSDRRFEIKDEAAQVVLAAPFGEVGSGARDETPAAAGPHARPSLMNPDATPGTGMLPPIGDSEDSNMQASG